MAERTCSLEGCDRPIRTRGMCARHYLDWYKANGPQCIIEGCTAIRLARKMCVVHYGRWRRHGDPMLVAPRGCPAVYTGCSVEGCPGDHFCKTLCSKHYDRARYAADPEKHRRQRRASNARPHVKAAIDLANRARREADPQLSRERNRASYAKHIDRRREDARRQYAADPDARKIGDHRRRARILKSDVNDLTAAQWREIRALYRYRCAYCHAKPKRLTMDHVIPLARGGHHTASNVVPACGPCNARKHAGPAPTYQPALM